MQPLFCAGLCGYTFKLYGWLKDNFHSGLNAYYKINGYLSR